MSDQRTKLWIGVGAFMVLGTPPAMATDGVPAAPRTHASSYLLASADTGGEGGEAAESEATRAGADAGMEGGEGGEGAFSPMGVFDSGAGGEGGEAGEGSGGPDAARSPGVYYTDLALALGHLRVARDLYRAGQGDVAAMHLAHPAAEILPQLEEALEQRGLEDVAERIRDLARIAGTRPSWSDVESDYERTRDAIAHAMSDVDASRRHDPTFISRALTALLLQARHEYGDSIDDGHFEHGHEYQDGYGMVHVGRELLEQHADVLRAADASAYATLVRQYESAMEAWPSATVPAQPALSVSELSGRVSAFEFTANRF